MSRFGILGSKSGTAKSGAAGGRTTSIGDFAKKNPDLMKMDASQRQQLMTQFITDAKMAELGSRKANKGFQLPGTAPAKAPDEKDLSKSAKQMLEQMIQKQIKKRKKEVVAIRACWFGNGRITKDGKILDGNNKQVGTIDPETMRITVGMSFMGKYKDDSFTLTKLQRKIEQMNAPKAGFGGGSSGGVGIGNFYGTADTNTSNGWW